MSNNLALENKETTLDDFPPVLRKLAEKVMEKYNFGSLQELCNNEGMSYRSVLNAISREKKKGNDFRMLLYSLLDYRNKCLLPFVDNVVYGKALESDMTAAKLFYQRTGAIQTGSGGDRVQVNNQINLAFTPPLPDKDVIDI